MRRVSSRVCKRHSACAAGAISCLHACLCIVGGTRRGGTLRGVFSSMSSVPNSGDTPRAGGTAAAIAVKYRNVQNSRHLQRTAAAVVCA